jgi:biotin transporter BioY
VKGLIRFVIIAGLVGYLAHEGIQRAAYSLDIMSFVIGIAVAGVTGFAWYQLGAWSQMAIRPSRCQTVTIPTRETPNQISCAATLAIVYIVVAILAIAAVVAGIELGII